MLSAVCHVLVSPSSTHAAAVKLREVSTTGAATSAKDPAAPFSASADAPIFAAPHVAPPCSVAGWPAPEPSAAVAPAPSSNAHVPAGVPAASAPPALAGRSRPAASARMPARDTMVRLRTALPPYGVW